MKPRKVLNARSIEEVISSLREIVSVAKVRDGRFPRTREIFASRRRGLPKIAASRKITIFVVILRYRERAVETPRTDVLIIFLRNPRSRGASEIFTSGREVETKYFTPTFGLFPSFWKKKVFSIELRASNLKKKTNFRNFSRGKSTFAMCCESNL